MVVAESGWGIVMPITYKTRSHQINTIDRQTADAVRGLVRDLVRGLVPVWFKVSSRGT